MRPPTITLLLLSFIHIARAQSRTDYFFRFIGGNAITDGQRLRGNNSMRYNSPGATRSPFNPSDHFKRISTDASVPSASAVLNVVPTNPHPPPVPGYYGLSDHDGVEDAYRLVSTYRLDDEGPGFKYRAWELRKSEGGKVLLRYSGDVDGEWRWIAVRETVSDSFEGKGLDKWVPWYVKPSSANVAALSQWDYRVVDLELVETRGAVNSGAPGGVEE